MEATLPGLEGKQQIPAKLREGGMGSACEVRHAEVAALLRRAMGGAR